MMRYFLYNIILQSFSYFVIDTKIAVQNLVALFFVIIIFSVLSVFSSVVAFNNDTIMLDKTIMNKTSVYGCEKYNTFLHCDPFKNEFKGDSTIGNKTKVSDITREPIYVDGQNNKAIEFIDSFREYVEIPNNEAYDFHNFSISFWIKRTNISNLSEPLQYVISHTTNNKKDGWFFNTNDSENQSIQFGLTTNSGEEPTMSRPIAISNLSFTHIATTFNGSEIQVYRNGIPFESIRYNGSYDSTQKLPIHIGSASFCSSCKKFRGIVDDIRLYNLTISKDEISQIYNSINDNITDSVDAVKNNKNNLNNQSINNGLVGHWTFDETLTDLSPVKNHGKMFTLLSSMVSAPDGRIFISEKNTGQIKILKNDVLLEKLFVVINDSFVSYETGLLGLAIDPQFENNYFVYLYYTAIKNDGDDDRPVNRVVKLTDVNNTAVNMTVILDDIPASRGFHAGGAMAFGPDNKLYISAGDATRHESAQLNTTLSGKILRINSDGSTPNDNPFPYSQVYTLGHRNIFGIAFDIGDKIGIATENGASLYDEINLIEPGGNYGFPTWQPENIPPELSTSTIDIKPLRSYWNTIAPTQAIYHIGDRIPILKDTFLFGTFTGNIYSIHIDNETKTIDSELHIKIRNSPIEPLIGIAQNANGEVYFGAYHVYKLLSISKNETQPVIFPLVLKYSKDITINKVSAEMGKYVVIDFYVGNDNVTIQNSPNSYLKVKVPQSLVQVIGNVSVIEASSRNNEDNQNVIPFYFNENTTNYNEITIPITFKDLRMEISINSNSNQKQL